MKIKEVISQTGLTDRAIRLYIENGLVTPENEKSYNGRNNYKFTQTDINHFSNSSPLVAFLSASGSGVFSKLALILSQT